MKKIFIGILSVLSLIILMSCIKEKPKEKEEKPVENTSTFNHDKDLDKTKVFFDDFKGGIDKNKWVVFDDKWSHPDHGGVIKENVNYTKDGVLVLQANGDHYEGPLRGYQVKNGERRENGKRTGAVVSSRDFLGPGRFETRIKVMPRFGATTAFWTFFYEDAKAGQVEKNHELDIELAVKNDFRKMQMVNWTALKNSASDVKDVGFAQNDGNWHTYRFDWRTNPKRVDYFIDDVLVSTIIGSVPTHAGVINIGHWFPNGWAGTPNFETDYMFVDWFKYTPFLNNEYIPSPKIGASPDSFYPANPIELPIANLISNGNFNYDNDAFRMDVSSQNEILTGKGLDGSNAFYLPKSDDDEAYQRINGADDSFEYKLDAVAKIPENGSGKVIIKFNGTKGYIGSKEIIFDSSDADFKVNKFYKKTLTFKPLSGTKEMEIVLKSDKSEITFDNLYMNLKKIADLREENVVSDQNITYSDFRKGINRSDWKIQDFAWGQANGHENGGVIKENVNYSKDGLVLTANGDFYDGNLRGIKQAGGTKLAHGRRTGAAITSIKSFGPGSFEVKAKILPRFGATSAFWTYYNPEGGLGINHEIDIELNVENDFKKVWFTNYIKPGSGANKVEELDFANNDGTWHTYRFDWHTDDPRVEYYIDGVKYHTATTKIPTKSMVFNIGLWFPKEWAGVPDFETDHMIVEYFKHTAFEDEEFEKTPDEVSAPISYYPTQMIESPVANLIANGNMKSALGYNIVDATIDYNKLYLNKPLSSVSQKITGLNDLMKMGLKVNARGEDLLVEVDFLDENNINLGKKTINLNNFNTATFTENSSEFDLALGTRTIIITFKASNLVVDNIFLNNVNRL